MEGYVFNFPLPRGNEDNLEQVRKIERAVSDFRNESKLYSWSDDDALDPMNGKACLALMEVIAECEKMMRRFPPWMVDGCAIELMARSMRNPEEDKQEAMPGTPEEGER